MDGVTGVTPDVSVSVVTYDNESCIAELVRQVEAQTGVSWELLVFDNASRDRTREILCSIPSVRLSASDSNVGYSTAHNRNIRNARGRYILLLNADVRFSPDDVSTLVAHLDRHPELSLVGPTILEGDDQRPFPPRRFYPGEGMIPLEKGFTGRDIAWLNGCCILARSEALRELGGFDEKFFLYQAETDLCLRARRLGMSLGWVPEVVVHHLHRQSQQHASEYEYARRIFEGSATFWTKHYPECDVLAMASFQVRVSEVLLAAWKIINGLHELPPELNRQRLKARRDVCRELIASMSRTGRTASATARIARRQCHLALQWARQGRFPLDDY